MKRVLAVDDTITFRIMLSNCLKKAGHDVIEAENGKEALEKLRLDPPDIVITDLNMPVMDGLDFIENARKRSTPASALPMLLLTTEVAEHLEAAGARRRRNRLADQTLRSLRRSCASSTSST